MDIRATAKCPETIRSRYQERQCDRLVDATGAGDPFAAGFLFGLVRNAGHENAGRLGARSQLPK
jgi:sugar/nucleoside kinase (ribokinase family)